MRPKEEEVTGGWKKLFREERRIFLFFLWLFCPFPGHGLPCFQLKFQNNRVLRVRVVNPTPNTYLEDKDFMLGLRLAAVLRTVGVCDPTLVTHRQHSPLHHFIRVCVCM